MLRKTLVLLAAILIALVTVGTAAWGLLRAFPITTIENCVGTPDNCEAGSTSIDFAGKSIEVSPAILPGMAVVAGLAVVLVASAIYLGLSGKRER